MVIINEMTPSELESWQKMIDEQLARRAAMTTFDPDLKVRGNCTRCFWSAPMTRDGPEIWCAHAVHHGWKNETDAASCNGDGFRIDDREATVDEEGARGKDA